MSRLLVTFCLAVSASVPALPAAAQGTASDTHAASAETLPSPLSDPERSLRQLTELRRLDPHDMVLHLAAAREGAALGIVALTRDERIARAAEAVEAARAAVALDAASADAHYWLAASLGLQADQEGGKTKITLAVEAYHEAQRALELDPRHAGAHHVVGRLHTGTKHLSWMTRLIARGLGLGAILDQASWASAEFHLRTAVERDPDPLVHHVELAKLYLRRGREAEGVAILESIAGRRARYSLDEHYISEAQQILAELRGR
jgi:tetratricopeptide (TPR) repeat protein